MIFTSRRCLIWPLAGVLFLAGCAGTSLQPSTPYVEEHTEIKGQPVKVAITPSQRNAYARALKSLQGNNYKQAEQQLLQLIRQNPQLSGPHANLAIVYLRTRRYEAAVASFAKSIELNPRRAEVYNQLGVALRQLGRFEEARAAYVKALSLKPDYASAHLNIGILYDLYLRQLHKALHHYERYQAIAGEDRKVKLWIVDIQRQMEKAASLADERHVARR